jgi:hypothetical protein
VSTTDPRDGRDHQSLLGTFASGWRAERLRRAVPCTSAYLAIEGTQERILAAYLGARLPTSVHVVAEGYRFLDFVERIAPPLAHLTEIVALDRALLLAHASRPHPSRERRARPAVDAPVEIVSRHPAAAVIEFEADPTELLDALLTGTSLPLAGSGRGAVVVGPGVPGLYRIATPDEERLVSALGDGLTAAVVSPVDADVARDLIAAGVLVPDEPHLCRAAS